MTITDSEFPLLGDALWLDFVNTARGRDLRAPDLLQDESALLRWSSAQNIYLNGGPPPLPSVLQLRDRLTALAEALHGGLQPPAGAIAAINEQLAQGGGCHQLTRVNGEWQLRFAPGQRPTILQAIAQSAATTLADSLRFVRRCAGQGCMLFFSDDSPNQSRRWCSPAVCGGEIKVERRRGLRR
jgi:predicted RNA-binding Zn ribbon-like protein